MTSAHDPVTTPEQLYVALNSANPGETVYIAGDWAETLNLANYWNGNVGKNVVIDGLGQTKLLKGVGVESCGFLTLKNMDVYEGVMGCVNLSNSYKDTTLKGVTLDNLNIYNSHSRGIFMGAYTCSDLLIENCCIMYTTYGTHAIYLSGGHWENSTAPILNTRIIGCEIGYVPAGRFGIQLNGRFVGVTVKGNLIYHTQLGGVSFKGVQDGRVTNNIVFGCNRGIGVSLHDYAAQWAPYFNYFETPADREAFLATHQPNRQIMIDRNTFVGGPTQFSVDPYHNDDPEDGHPIIQISSQVMGDPQLKEWFPEFTMEDIYVKQNVLWSPNGNIVEPTNEEEAKETHFIDNLCWTPGEGMRIGGYGRVGELAGTVIEDPEFNLLPTYERVDLGVTPYFDFATHNSDADVFSSKAYGYGVGKKYPFPVLGQDDRVPIGE